MKLSVINIGGKDFLTVRRIRYQGVVYQEMACADKQSPNIVYLDETGKVLEDENIFNALRDKFSLDRNFEKTGEMTIRKTPAAKRAAMEKKRIELFKAIDKFITASKQNAYKAGVTVLDVGTELGGGLAKLVEGVADAGIGVTAGVGSIFGADTKWAEDIIKFDATQEWYYSWENELTKDSALQGTIAQDITRGVGQQLPTITAIALAPVTGGTSLAVVPYTIGATITSAGGSAMEEALNEGANFNQSMAYGASQAALEGSVELVTKGAGKGIWRLAKEQLIEEAGKTTAKRAVRVGIEEGISEGIEEGIVTAANPAAKTIYKGEEALQEYNDPKFPGKVIYNSAVGASVGAITGGASTVFIKVGQDGKVANKQELDVALQQGDAIEIEIEGVINEKSIEACRKLVSDIKTVMGMPGYLNSDISINMTLAEGNATAEQAQGIYDIIMYGKPVEKTDGDGKAWVVRQHVAPDKAKIREQELTEEQRQAIQDEIDELDRQLRADIKAEEVEETYQNYLAGMTKEQRAEHDKMMAESTVEERQGFKDFLHAIEQNNKVKEDEEILEIMSDEDYQVILEERAKQEKEYYRQLQEAQDPYDGLFAKDWEKFSRRAAERFGHIVEKNGITDPEAWFQERFRGDGLHRYSIDNKEDSAGLHYPSTGKITFTEKYIDDEFIRAHEMMHKATRGPERTGVLEATTVHDNPLLSFTEGGRALNEGFTDHMAEKVTGIKRDSGYVIEGFLADRMTDMVGEDTCMEAMLFGPEKMQNKFNELSGDEYMYRHVTLQADSCYWYNRDIERMARESGKTNTVKGLEEYNQTVEMRDAVAQDALAGILEPKVRKIREAKNAAEANRYAQELINYSNKIINDPNVSFSCSELMHKTVSSIPEVRQCIENTAQLAQRMGVPQLAVPRDGGAKRMLAKKALAASMGVSIAALGVGAGSELGEATFDSIERAINDFQQSITDFNDKEKVSKLLDMKKAYQYLKDTVLPQKETTKDHSRDYSRDHNRP